MHFSQYGLEAGVQSIQSAFLTQAQLMITFDAAPELGTLKVTVHGIEDVI